MSHSPEKPADVGNNNNNNNPIVAKPSNLAKDRSQGSGSDESASHWFDNVNQHVPQSTQDDAGYDGTLLMPITKTGPILTEPDEPPFFITNQASYLPNQYAPSESSKMFGVQSRLDSENEELRGVIDDLTVENKRLKQILRTSHRSQRGTPSQDGEDKLFEVRMHGLTADKRRELEYLLKNFATSVRTTAPSMTNSTSNSGLSPNSHSKNRGGKTDSGYASNSNSGQASLMNSLAARPVPGVSQSARDKSIKNYLHDVPDTLMPRQQPVVMSERARMALVVRRLEQLFTGRKAAPGEHSLFLQQQEVSDMAARAEAKGTKRKAEGSREAHILPPDSKVNFDAMDVGVEKRQPPRLRTSESDTTVSEGNGGSTSRSGSPDQRPTRPLDLDIHRAQVAAENIQYLRHLGLSSPRVDTEESDDSWIYLNLLINMAQLHTINVTPEFVRKSIKKLSTKFRLSRDGHKVSWIGGSEGTTFSREEEKALEIVDHQRDATCPDESNEDSGTGGSSKRSKTDTNSNAVASNTATSSADKTSALQTSDTSKQQVSTAATSNMLSSLHTKPSKISTSFDYKPIVYRERSVQLPESYLQDSDSSLDDSSGGSSGLANALSRSNLNQQRNSDEGLITFYNNPFFCSDYSGDKTPQNMLRDREAEAGVLLGIDPAIELVESPSRLAGACYFTPQFGPPQFRAADNENLPSLDLTSLRQAGEEETQPLEFGCSGLGGITPDDNFAVDVHVHMVTISSDTVVNQDQQSPRTGNKAVPKFLYRQGKSNKIDLLPSRLPPPSYVFFTSSSSEGNQNLDESDGESEETSSIVDEENVVPPLFLQRWSHEDSGEYEDSEGGVQDDSSIDMLAIARAADPVQIAEQERQYVINQPGGRAVAGSLAATVGASRSASSNHSIDSGEVEFDSGSEAGSRSESEGSMDVDV